MSESDGVTRREFVVAAGSAALVSLAPGAARAAGARKRYAIVGTGVRGGPTYREMQLCMEMIADTGRLRSLDVVELNPALDVRNSTAGVAVELIESLFGKSTLAR